MPVDKLRYAVKWIMLYIRFDHAHFSSKYGPFMQYPFELHLIAPDKVRDIMIPPAMLHEVAEEETFPPELIDIYSRISVDRGIYCLFKILSNPIVGIYVQHPF